MGLKGQGRYVLQEYSHFYEDFVHSYSLFGGGKTVRVDVESCERFGLSLYKRVGAK